MKKCYLLLIFCSFFGQYNQAQVDFIDITQEAGIVQLGLNNGVAIADYNNDGLDDIFATRSILGGQLYRNNGDGSFANATEMAGITTSNSAQFAVWGDLNNDGWLDLFIAARDEGNSLFFNNQDGTFTDMALSAGVGTGTKVKAALLADVDMDGWLDIYLARLGMENILYHNNGNGTFSNITIISGASDPSISMGAVFVDYDNDGDPDLYLTHDANIPNILYRNNGNGTFSNVSVISGANIAAMGMGVDVGDVNNDGWLDIYITNLGANTLLLNNGNGSFTDISQTAGVGDTGMGWGCSFFDFDNDGWQDIYVANDGYFSPKPNLLYRNNGNNTFSVVSADSPLQSMEAGYGFGCFDFDNDGRIDILLANNSGVLGNQLFRNNDSNENNWLKVKLNGVESNSAGIGARLLFKIGDRTLVKEVNGGSGWASQNSLVQHVGLGSAGLVDLLTLNWPSGIIDSFENVAANQILEVTEGETKIVIVEPAPEPDTLKWIAPIGMPSPHDIGMSSATDENSEVKLNFEIQPNPTNQSFSILFEGGLFFSESFQVNVLNAIGQKMHSVKDIKMDAKFNSIKIDASNFSPGIYFVQVQIGGKMMTKILLKT
ncbi:MAG: T9SS type A sorting domain-containing protein [Bacteroidetes bacterium]|nr:T9SS type A sorting domain-containing protein [Bacteroidota bacterium]